MMLKQLNSVYNNEQGHGVQKLIEVMAITWTHGNLWSIRSPKNASWCIAINNGLDINW